MVVLLIPATVWAAEGLLYLDCYSKTNCGFCDAVKLVTKIARMAMTLAGSAALLVVVLAGLKMVLSRGISAEVAQAKKMLVGAITGILIVYGAWIFVNFVLYSFLSGGKVGVPQILTNTPWNQIKCIREPDQETISFTERYNSITTNQTTGFSDDGGCDSKSGKTCGGSCGGFNITGIATFQCSDASTSLKNFLEDLKGALPKTSGSDTLSASDILITSVSDNHGLLVCRGNNYFVQCPQDGKNHDNVSCCYHTKNSCHYGNDKTDGSYAIDVRSTALSDAQKIILKTLVESNNGQFYDEGGHIHISTKSCGAL